jgi:hypothetical protein
LLLPACYTTPRTSWPDADFSTGGNGASGGTGGSGMGAAGNGGGTGLAGSVGGGGAGVAGISGTGGTVACSPSCAPSAYCDNGACKSRVTEFTVQDVGAKPRNIVAGADGNLWFTDSSYDKIRRISPGGTISEFIVPTSGSGLGSITAGPDGNVWFTEENGGKIGRITPKG